MLNNPITVCYEIGSRLLRAATMNILPTLTGRAMQAIFMDRPHTSGARQLYWGNRNNIIALCYQSSDI